MQIFLSIILMLLMLSILTVVHEWGHFIAARIFKIKVIEFSIFMGPRIWHHKSEKTGTDFSIRCLPIGGYCAFEDDKGNADAPDSLYSQKWWKRAIVLLAGVTMNIILALVLSAVVVAFCGHDTNKIVKVEADSTAEFVGIEAGDRIFKINGTRVTNYMDETLATYGIQDNNDAEEIMESHYDSVYKKADGTKIHYDIKKRIDSTADKDGKLIIGKCTYDITAKNLKTGDVKNYRHEMTIGEINKEDYTAECGIVKAVDGKVISEETKSLPYTVIGVLGNDYIEHIDTKNPLKLVAFGWNEMISMVKSVYKALAWLITGKIGLEAVSGPIGLTTVVNDVVVSADVEAKWKIIEMVYMAALISANLGVMNALPFPGLDGCHLLFIVIELLRGGKKIKPETQAIISNVGLIALVLFAVVVMGSDILKIVRGG